MKFIKNYNKEKAYVIIGQKAVVFNQKGEILLMKRSDKSTRAGGWDFPGGGLNKEEDPIKGIEREIQEETGLKVNNTRVIHIFSSIEPNNDFIVSIGYISYVDNEKVKLSWEHDSYIWVSPKEALGKNLPEVHKNFLKAVIKGN